MNFQHFSAFKVFGENGSEQVNKANGHEDANKLREFECAGQREGDFDKNFQAVELASEVSSVGKEILD